MWVQLCAEHTLEKLSGSTCRTKLEMPPDKRWQRQPGSQTDPSGDHEERSGLHRASQAAPGVPGGCEAAARPSRCERGWRRAGVGM